MSGFVIHGISRSQILATAKRKVDANVITRGGRFVRPRTESEWERAVALGAAALYNSARPSAISPKFDAPQFAEQWASMAMRSGDIESFELMAYQPTGGMNPKTKLPEMKWLRYTAPTVPEAA